MPYAQAGGGDGAANPTPADYFNALPIITKCWFGVTAVTTLSVNFGVIDGYHVAWIWDNVSTKLEVYRFLTPFCYAGPFSLPLLLLMYMLWSFSKLYENGVPFNTGGGGGTADYAFMMIFGMLSMLATWPLLRGIGFFLKPTFCDNLVYYVLYVWSKKNPNDNSNIWGFPIRGVYLPFAYLALTVLQGHPFESMIHGMAIGHLYYFLADVVPIVYGKDFLQTPSFLINYFGYFDFTPPAAGTRPSGNRGGFGSVHGGNAGNSNNNNTSTSTSGSFGRASNDGPRNRGGHDWGSGGTRLGSG